MAIKKTIGRPPKVDVRTMIKLADMLLHSTSVSDACRYAGISRDTYYRHLRKNTLFAHNMRTAKARQYHLLSFLTFR